MKCSTRMLLVTPFAASLILSGCWSNPLQQEVAETKKQNREIRAEIHPNVEYADSIREDKTVEEALEEEEAPEALINPFIEKYDTKSVYEDADEFAAFVGDVLFDFRSGELSPENMHAFLHEHGSVTQREYHEHQEHSIDLFSNVQSSYNNLQTIDHLISVVEINEENEYGIFYRQVTFMQEQPEYYTTVIINEDGEWKFEDNRQSVKAEFFEGYGSKD